MAPHKDQKFNERMETAAKARAEMLAKAKERAEAAKATADERAKERAAIAAEGYFPTYHVEGQEPTPQSNLIWEAIYV